MEDFKRGQYMYEAKADTPMVYTSGREDRRNRRKVERSSKRKKIKPLS